MIRFEKKGRGCTEQTLEIARARADDLGIRYAVVATTTGETGARAARVFEAQRVVVVTHSCGFATPGRQQYEAVHIEAAEAAGAHILTATHAFGGVGRAIRRKLQTFEPEEIIAQSLRIFGEGTKVAVEISMMAADAGLVPIDEDVIAIGGTGHGCDTALVLQPAHVQDFFDIKVREIVCKPEL